MSLEGDLEDVVLSGLIQMACSEKKTARLTIRAPEGKGDVFFHEGEIVHAEFGLLEGEKALYKVLGWTSGRFRLSTGCPPPATRTIRISWNKLLMEGMRRLDEGRRDDAGQQAANNEGGPGTTELRLETDLLALVSQLEQRMARCDGRKLKAKPPLLLQVLGDLVNDVAEFSERIPDARLADSLRKALLRVNDEFPYARILRAKSNRLSVQTAISVYSNWTDTAESREYLLRQLRQVLLQILEEFFEFFAACFENADAGQQWRDTYRVYLADLTQAVTEIVP